MINKVELLSPAGNLEKLKIAFAYGADAVYGGTSSFSLRSRSGKEFDFDSYSEGIKYSHKLGKKIYATINSFPFNSQIKSYKSHILKISKLQPDAFIVSTPGVIQMVNELAPEIPIHLSTQANVMNIMDAQVYYNLGVRRIIVAREISLKDCEEIKKYLPNLELEIFIHGAMCFAYSGRCLISSLQKGRVPNRGSCANDCRFPYDIYAHNHETNITFKLEEDNEIGTYIMNSKDLNMINHIDKILDSGVISSLKIEGRTKSPYYVGVVTKSYRNAINDFYHNTFSSEKYAEELNTTQNRGFTDAYLLSRPFEKHNTQSHNFTIQNGSHKVVGLVNEDGLSWKCKDKVEIGDNIEILLPFNQSIQEISNKYGSIKNISNKFYLNIKKLISVEGKEFNVIHSGNLNNILLPSILPSFTILRIKNI